MTGFKRLSLLLLAVLVIAGAALYLFWPGKVREIVFGPPVPAGRIIAC